MGRGLWTGIPAVLALVLALGATAHAAPWDGEWEGTVRHDDLPCSPCRVRLTVSNGLAIVKSSASIPNFSIGPTGDLTAEVPIQVAGNAVRSNCRLTGKALTGGTISALGNCGNYSTQADLQLRRISAAPSNTAVAAAPATPAVPPPNSPPAAPPPAAIAKPATSAPAAVAPGFGAGTRPIRLGSVSYGIAPGSTIGQITTGSWLAACGSNGRSAPMKHQPNTQPNAKTVGEEFERVMNAAGYTPRRTIEEQADYLLLGKVTAVNVNYCLRENTRPIQSSGDGTVSIEWTVVALAGGRSVYQTSTTGSFELPTAERSTDGAREVFAGTFRDALNRLASDSGFRNAVAVAPATQSARSGEGAITIRPGPRFANGITTNMDRILSSVVEVRVSSGSGTAFVVDARGYLLTNAHVVGANDTVTVRFNDGQTLEANVLRRDPLRDIALLKIERAGLRPIPIRTGKLTLTEKVFAVGNPLGLSQTVTDGIVSAYRQNPNNGQEYVQASVNITFGNSGGPLLDAHGNVVGVSVSAAFGGALGLNFFIPIESALSRLELKLGG